MAKEGRKLTSFYAAPVCSPSRGSLMTGCYPKRCLPIRHVLFPGNDVGLNPAEITIPEVLKPKGYTSAVVGKWHLGDQPAFMPTEQGFDYYFGLPYSNDMGPAEDGVKSDLGKPLPKAEGKGQPPLPLLRNTTVLKRVLADDQQSLVELYTDEAVKFIGDHKADPFFLYLPHSAVHFPIYPGKTVRRQVAARYYSDWVEEVDWSVGQVSGRGPGQRPGRENAGPVRQRQRGHGPRVERPAAGAQGEHLGGRDSRPGDRLVAGPDPPGHRNRRDHRDVRRAADGRLPGRRQAPGPQTRRGEHLAATGRHARDQAAARHVLLLPRAHPGRRPPRRLEAPLSDRTGKTEPAAAKLYDLKADVGETTDVADANPAVLKTMSELIAAMKDDLGTTGIGPGCRPLGKVDDAKPIIGHDGEVRAGFTKEE